jgi:hypothetical protein
MLPAALQFLIAMIAYAINERMHRKLEYTQEEVRVPKDILVALTGSQRISFTADQRRRLAVADKVWSPEERKKCRQVVKPETILRWFRRVSLGPGFDTLIGLMSEPTMRRGYEEDQLLERLVDRFGLDGMPEQ